MPFICPITAAQSSSGGTVTVSNSPSFVEGAFIPQSARTSITPSTIVWSKISASQGQVATLGIGYGNNGQLFVLSFAFGNARGSEAWQCISDSQDLCSGVTFYTSAGTLTLLNTTLESNSSPPITLNGTLTFAPF